MIRLNLPNHQAGISNVQVLLQFLVQMEIQQSEVNDKCQSDTNEKRQRAQCHPHGQQPYMAHLSARRSASVKFLQLVLLILQLTR